MSWNQRLEGYELTLLQVGRPGVEAVLAVLMKAHDRVPHPTGDAKVSVAGIICRCKMYQTNGVTRLIQLESSGLASVAKFSVDRSAVMDRAFGRVRAGECARRTRRRISQPA